MKNIVLIVGARPNFMKAFSLYEALKADFSLTLIHTAQHYDDRMSKVFFEQLRFPRPDVHLSLTKTTKAGDFDDKLYINNVEYLKNKDRVIHDLLTYKGELGQIGEIRDKLKTELGKAKPDLVIVFGDVTSTLAAGLASKMLNIDIAHVESGLRSGDIGMPEEVNRILTDHVSHYHFVTEQSGVNNLQDAGITENVYLVGNTMIDTQKKYLQKALDTKYHGILGVKKGDYVLVTLHRPSNVDDLVKLKEIFDDLDVLSKTNKLVYPIHPRTKNNLGKLGYLGKVQNNKNIVLQEPLGYLEFTCLMANCKYVITDSGGVQEETTGLNIPCFTLRENTERPCTLNANHGTNQMIRRISEIKLKKCKGSMDLWDGKSSERIKMILQDPKIKYIYDSDRNMHLYVNNNSKKTIIFFSSSVSKEKRSKFMMNRISWMKQLKDYNLLYISDHLRNKYDIPSGHYLYEIINSWNKKRNLVIDIVKNVETKDMIFYGTSSGGFASLYFGSYFNNATILIENAQLNLFSSMNNSSIEINIKNVVELLKSKYGLSFSNQLNIKILKEIFSRYQHRSCHCTIFVNKDDRYHYEQLNKLDFILNNKNTEIIVQELTYSQYKRYEEAYLKGELKNCYGMAHNQVLKVNEFKNFIGKKNDSSLSLYDLKVKNNLLLPNSKYYLRDECLKCYDSKSKYMNFSYYSYFWSNSIVFKDKIPYNYFTAKKIIPNGIHTFYTTIGNYALCLYSIYSEILNKTRNLDSFIDKFGKNKSIDFYKDEFLFINDFIVKEMTANNNELKNNFSLNQGCGRLIIKGDSKFHTIKKGWKSSLAYGVILSSLSRAYYLTNKDIYKDKAILLLKGYQDNSFRSTIFGNVFYEEYPTSKGHYVLNGFIFSLIGLYDVHNILGNNTAKELFDNGVKTLETLIPLYDLGDGSCYDLQHIHTHTPPIKARWQYHCTHIEQLKTMYLITNKNIFKIYYERFKQYLLGNYSMSL